MTTNPLQDQLKHIQSYAEADPERALSAVTKIIDEGIESAAARMLKACVHFQQNEYDLAAQAFAKVIKRKPKDDRASLSLFHSLWSNGKVHAAFEEMKRYFRETGLDNQSIATADYRSIIEEINKAKDQ